MNAQNFQLTSHSFNPLCAQIFVRHLTHVAEHLRPQWYEHLYHHSEVDPKLEITHDCYHGMRYCHGQRLVVETLRHDFHASTSEEE